MFWTVLHIVGYPAQPPPLTGCSTQGVFKQPRRDSTILKRTAVRENTKQTWFSSNCQPWRPFWANVLFVCGSNSQQKTWKADRPTNHWVNRIRKVPFIPVFWPRPLITVDLSFLHYLFPLSHSLFCCQAAIDWRTLPGSFWKRNNVALLKNLSSSHRPQPSSLF